MFEFLRTVRSPGHRKAWFVAIMADAIQIIGFPMFFPGGFSPFDIALDAVTAAILTKVLGWHWAFLPTFAAELVPGLDLFPTWTAAVLFVTRTQVRTVEPEILRPGPAPQPRP
jgi:hypothetical protein